MNALRPLYFLSAARGLVLSFLAAIYLCACTASQNNDQLNAAPLAQQHNNGNHPSQREGALAQLADEKDPLNTDKMSTAQRRERLKQYLLFMKLAKKNIKTAKCKHIDAAMAYSFLFQQISQTMPQNKNSGIKKDDYRLKAAAIIYKGYYTDFKTEYAKRCPGKPARTERLQKAYPEIMARAKRKAKQNKTKKN